jgi:two-component system response regulator RegA
MSSIITAQQQDKKQNRYLLVDDDAIFSQVLSRALAQRNIDSCIANSTASALIAINKPDNRISHAVVDLNLGNDSGLNLIPQLLESSPKLQLIVLTGYSSIATAVEAVKRGACNYLCKPASAQNIIDAFNPENQQKADPALHQEQPSAERLQWEYIQKTLAENDGNISATARTLGMHRRTLQRKLQKKPVSQ